jgi:hypothetical protein
MTLIARFTVDSFTMIRAHTSTSTWPESVIQYRPRVQAFWACASGRCSGTDSNHSGFLHNANF